MKMAIVWLACAGALAWPVAGVSAPAQQAQSSTAASSAPQLTFEQKVQLFVFGNLDTGQPNQSCEDLGNQPGQAQTARGSAFNPDGIAGTHYAGEQPQNSKNPKSVSQYDVACARPGPR